MSKNIKGEIFKKEKIMKKNPIIFIVTISILAILFFICLVIILTQITGSNRDYAIIQPYLFQIAEKNKIIAEYKAEYEKIIEIKEQYRSSVKDLVELLYNKDTYLGIGGSDISLIPESDESALLQIKNTVLTMEDDLRMLLNVKQYLEARKTFSDNFPFIWPTNKGGVPATSSTYGLRENKEIYPGKEGIHLHTGFDIPGELNDDIIATADGIVLTIKRNDSNLGNYIVIEHQYGFTTIYGHLNSILVVKGQQIKRGDLIGKMGNTGISTGVHLHYEIRKDDISIDPRTFLNMNF